MDSEFNQRSSWVSAKQKNGYKEEGKNLKLLWKCSGWMLDLKLDLAQRWVKSLKEHSEGRWG